MTDLAEALARLVARGVLDERQAAAVAAEVSPLLGDVHEVGAVEQPGGLRGRAAELAGYVGGALVLGAALIFLSSYWPDFSRPLRVGLMAGATVVLAGAGLLVGARDRDRPGTNEVTRRLGSTLWCAAAATAAVGALSAVIGPDVDGGWGGLAAGCTGAVVAAVGYRRSPSALGQITVATFLVIAVASAVSLTAIGDSPAIGLSVAAVGVAWWVLARLHVLVETRFALTVAVSLVFLGGQLAMFWADGAAWDYGQLISYVLTLGAGVAAFAAYTRTRFWGLLVVGVLAVTTVVTQLALDLAPGSLGASGALLVAGVTLLAASAVGFRLHARAVSAQP